MAQNSSANISAPDKPLAPMVDDVYAHLVFIHRRLNEQAIATLLDGSIPHHPCRGGPNRGIRICQGVYILSFLDPGHVYTQCVMLKE
jgi:hypothetical protein